MAPRRQTAQVVEVAPLGRGLARLQLEGEALGRDVTCGRFAMVTVPGHAECILPRPLSYFCAPDPHRVEFLLRDAGVGSRGLLACRPGDPVALLGPLGSRFPAPGGTCWAVAGGVGAAPFGAIAAHPGLRVLFGARSRTDIGFADALRARGATVALATDDGSTGLRGSVVDLLRQGLADGPPPDAIYTCGPNAMMAAVVVVARAAGVRTWVSLEERMGCGIGICRGCAHRDAAGGWRCICVDGPVYDAADIFA